MPKLLDLFGALAAQDVHDVACAKADATLLLHAVDGAEQLARRVGAVPNVRRRQAVVAILAGLAGFIKIAQQPHTPAIRRLGQSQERIELAAQAVLEFFAGGAFVNHSALVHHVLQAVQHPGVCGLAVTACTAGFLVVAFNVFGHVQMRDKAHVGLVDTHAKGNRGDHHHALAAQKSVLIGLAHGCVNSGVVRQRVHAFIAQRLCNFFHALARLAIDDAGIARVLPRDEADELLGCVFFLDDGVADVGPVKTADKGAGVLQLQALQYVGTRQCIGRGSQRNARHAGIALMEHGQPAVFGAEVVAPLAHAMRLVNCKQA